MPDMAPRPSSPVRGSQPALALATALFLLGCSEEPARDAPPPGPAVPYRGAELHDGFEEDALAAFWRAGDAGSGRYAPGAVELTDELARAGRRSARITVREGDVEQRGDDGELTERAELDSGRLPVLGRDVWYGYSFLVPRDFPTVDTRLVISQWKQAELEGSPLVAQRYVAGRHYATLRDLERGGRRADFDLPPIERGRWHDMVWHLRARADEGGYVEVWMDGERVAGCAGPLASSAAAPELYHKVGLYRDRMAAPMTLYLDEYAVGASFDAVTPAR